MGAHRGLDQVAVARRKREIIAQLRDGVPVKFIAAERGLSQSHVYKISRMAGCEKSQTRRTSDILSAYNSGEPIASICARFNVGRWAVRNLRRKWGVSARGQQFEAAA